MWLVALVGLMALVGSWIAAVGHGAKIVWYEDEVGGGYAHGAWLFDRFWGLRYRPAYEQAGEIFPAIGPGFFWGT